MKYRIILHWFTGQKRIIIFGEDSTETVSVPLKTYQLCVVIHNVRAQADPSNFIFKKTFHGEFFVIKKLFTVRIVLVPLCTTIVLWTL